MSETTLIQEQPTEDPSTTSTTEAQDGTYSEPTPENTAGGEESPPPTVGHAEIVEKDPDQDPEDAVTTVRDGSADQTANTDAPATEPLTVEQPDTTSTTPETTVVPANDTQTDAIVSVKPEAPAQTSNGHEASIFAGVASIPLLIAAGVKRFRRQK